MRDLEYQSKVLKAVDGYIAELRAAKAKADLMSEKLKDIEGGLDAVPDFTAEAWAKLKLPPSRAEIPFSPRRDGCNRPVPNVTLKVPTGGGKTFLAVNAVSRIMGRYLQKQVGFVLWIVPNEAIYTQTLKHLKNRQHPYRQTLDRAAAGRVKILEKTDRLDARDVEANLCVMVLMLQSANRETQDSLKMFQDRGDVHGFTPDQGAQQLHRDLLERIPNLAAYDLAEGTVGWGMVKDSLGNALRIIRPVVVMDEGQKAVSDLAFRTLYSFNPSFVLELSATPKDVKGKKEADARYANVLVEVTGLELDREGMIKMPLNLDPRQGADWKATLSASVAKLNELQGQADDYRGETRRYIRPIMLVQVERTGKEQRSGDYIHSEDVKEWLIKTGFDEAEIAIKTAEKNDLKEPENLDLLSETNQVRVIITKQALQEGWDCPFAYVLCSLAASSNKSAMTQLIGRILRQPYAEKTGTTALDECYVITHHAATADVVKAIKSGLEKDGLGDLILSVSGSEKAAKSATARTLKRREKFSTTRIFLPLLLKDDGGQMREFDYETDLLSQLDWRDFDACAVVESIPENAQEVEAQLQRIRLADSGELIETESIGASSEFQNFDATYAARSISDYVSNGFVARDIVERVHRGLKKRGFEEGKIGKLSGLIINELRRALERAHLEMAETIFKQEVAAGSIQFRLRADGYHWEMPFEELILQPEGARQLLKDGATPVDKSLFAPCYEDELNREEQDVAIYLDKDNALEWWHRSIARRGYGIPGWRRGRIYPDFIFAVNRQDGARRIIILETKGDQLDNQDTAYKRELLNVLSENFSWDTTQPVGQMEVLVDNGDQIECALILMDDIKSTLPEYLTEKAGVGRR